MPQDVAEGSHRRGGFRQKQGNKVDTKQIALNRQQKAAGAPCTIGASGHTSAFQPFSCPLGLHSASTRTTAGGSWHNDRAAAYGQQSGAQIREGAAQQEQHACNQGDANDALADVHGQQPQASGQAPSFRKEGRVDVHRSDRRRGGPSNVAPDAGGAASTGSLEAASDRAVAEQFRDMGGDAWKVFYMASKMGLRPDVIEKAANRVRSLQQHSE